MEQHNSLGTIKARRRRRHQQDKIFKIIIIVVAVIALLALIFGICYMTKALPAGFYPGGTKPDSSQSGDPGESSLGDSESAEETSSEAPTEDSFDVLVMDTMDQAETLAAMYDYDAAIAALQSIEDYEELPAITAKIAEYEETKGTLVKWADNTQITHIFFHSLIVDPELAFSSYKSDAYNQNMATVEEFNKVIQTMYDKGYVMVGLHDIAEMQLQEDGSYKMVQKAIYLPEGKIPFVLSQDDVCYYEYMNGHGFASRLVIGEDGFVTTEMDMADGTTVTGSYDMIPLIEDFVKEHPDFSYHGSKGIIALTGYEGVFGYRTSEYHYGATPADGYTANPNIEADRQTASEIATVLRNTGWEIASHSWGHPNLANETSCPWERFVWDCDMWESEVESIVGETDILIYPFGADVGTWRGYEDTNQRYAYLKTCGFNYFCNVDSSIAWVQITGSYFRQGRRNIDGTRLYEAIVATDRLSDLFDAADVIDATRPLPVPGVTPTEASAEGE